MGKHPFVVVLILALLVLFVSCTEEFSFTGTGTLEIQINSSIARGVETVSMDTASYNLTITNSSEEVIYSSMNSSMTSYTVKVPAGTYTAYVEALNADGVVIGMGGGEGTVVAGQTNHFEITVDEFSGDGTFAMKIKGDAGYNLEYKVYDAKYEVVTEGKLVYSNDLYQATVGLPKGFYGIEICCVDFEEGRKLYETFRVVCGKTTVFESDIDLSIKTSIVIDNEIVKTPKISLSLNSGIIRSDGTLMVSATVSDIDNYSCRWLVDGETLEGCEGTALELSMAEYTEGKHQIMLFVSNGTVIWSESKEFEVNDYPTSVTVSGDIEAFIIADVLVPMDLQVSVNVDGEPYGDLYARNFHQIINDLENNVISIESVSEEGYYAYMKTEYDSENDRTILYVIIDRYIEDPGYLTLKMNYDWILESGQVRGPSLQTEVDGTDIEWAILLSNDKSDRTIKVEPQTYYSRGNYGSNCPGYYFDINPSSFTVKAGETQVLELNGQPYGNLVVTAPDNDCGYDVYIDGSNRGSISGNEAYTDYKGVVGSSYKVLLVPNEADKAIKYFYAEGSYVEGENYPSFTEKELTYTDYGNFSFNSITFDTSAVIFPRNALLFVRIGDDLQAIRTPREYNYMTYADEPVSIAYGPGLENYSVTPSAVDNSLVLTYDLALEEGEYAVMDLVYDFTYDETFDGAYPSMRNGDAYYQMELTPEPRAVKVLPGSYSPTGCSRYGSSGSSKDISWAYISDSFTAVAGEHIEIHIINER